MFKLFAGQVGYLNAFADQITYCRLPPFVERKFCHHFGPDLRGCLLVLTWLPSPGHSRIPLQSHQPVLPPIACLGHITWKLLLPTVQKCSPSDSTEPAKAASSCGLIVNAVPLSPESGVARRLARRYSRYKFDTVAKAARSPGKARRDLSAPGEHVRPRSRQDTETSALEASTVQGASEHGIHMQAPSFAGPRLAVTSRHGIPSNTAAQVKDAHIADSYRNFSSPNYFPQTSRSYYSLKRDHHETPVSQNSRSCIGESGVSQQQHAVRQQEMPGLQDRSNLNISLPRSLRAGARKSQRPVHGPESRRRRLPRPVGAGNLLSSTSSPQPGDGHKRRTTAKNRALTSSLPLQTVVEEPDSEIEERGQRIDLRTGA